MAKDQSIQTPEMQRRLGGSEAPGNEEDPVDSTIHGGCGVILTLFVGGVSALIVWLINA